MKIMWRISSKQLINNDKNSKVNILHFETGKNNE